VDVAALRQDAQEIGLVVAHCMGSIAPLALRRGGGVTGPKLDS
jgi:hypothetical protein